MTQPSVSIVIPTLNAAHVLPACLGSIRRQRYDGPIEVIVADGGSTDATPDLAREHGARVVPNPLRTGEAGKAAGLRHARHDIVAFVDSDNVLEEDDWLARMVEPFADPAVAGAEPWSFNVRPQDSLLNRYCALLGANDPLCIFLGNYDRVSALTGRWTDVPVQARDAGRYLVVDLDPRDHPTIGANGFLARASVLAKLGLGDYYFDIDVVHRMAARGHGRVAKVKLGITHLYGRGLGTLARKQLRRIRDYHWFRRSGLREFPWRSGRERRVAWFVLSTVLVLPLLYQTARGALRRPDSAWWLHVPACWVTLAVYAWGTVEGLARPAAQDRSSWGQDAVR